MYKPAEKVSKQLIQPFVVVDCLQLDLCSLFADSLLAVYPIMLLALLLTLTVCIVSGLEWSDPTSHGLTRT